MRTSKKIVLTLFTVLTASSCGTNNNQLDLDTQMTQLNNNSVQAQFANLSEKEDEEVYIDEEYYKSFPDHELSSQISEIERGSVPEQVKTSSVDEVKAQSFLSIFNRKATIDIYDSFGTPEKFTVIGRVYKKKNIKPELTSDSKLKNVIRNIKYFTPDGIESIDVNVIAGGLSRIARTDNKGFFRAEFSNTTLPVGVSPLSAKLVANKYKYETPKEEIVIDKINSTKIGIISDIDDTVKYTGVDNKLNMIKKILVGNYKTDKQIPGVSALYKGILSETQSSDVGSVHYVTGSPSTLYSRIQNFLKLNNFPQGSLAMKSKGSLVAPTPSDTYNYKLSRIRPIMNAYPNKKFIMFGDTTQKDADVYLKIKQEFPQNVIGIYINNATKANPNDPKYSGTLVTDSAIDAAQDLLKKGIITQDSVNKVIAEVK